MSDRFRRPSGFTLIELLIVVAIIAILAAIAVPNFLEAQTRSKVSRTKSDIRSLRVALESYAVDTNHYPGDNSPNPAEYAAGRVVGLRRTTTPIAYITSIPFDIFAAPDPPVPNYELTYFRPNYAISYTGTRHDWIVASFGPDRKWDGAEYDPTNGTVSAGNISVRSGRQDSVDVAAQ